MKDFVLPLLTDEEMKLPFYVYAVGCKPNQEPILREEGYQHFIWLHTVKGKGKLYLENREYVLAGGSGVLIYPHVRHEYAALEEPWETHWVSFRGYAVQPLLELMGFPRSAYYEVPNLAPIDGMIEDLYLTTKSNSPDKGQAGSRKLYAFLLELKNHVDPDNVKLQLSYAARLQPILTFMEERYPEDLTLEQLAGAFGTSQQYFCRIFRKALQMSPFSYLTKLRMQKAKELLLLGDKQLTVAEIAARVGYRDTSYFCYVFKQHEGYAPLEFKRYSH